MVEHAAVPVEAEEESEPVLQELLEDDQIDSLAQEPANTYPTHYGHEQTEMRMRDWGCDMHCHRCWGRGYGSEECYPDDPQGNGAWRPYHTICSYGIESCSKYFTGMIGRLGKSWKCYDSCERCFHWQCKNDCDFMWNMKKQGGNSQPSNM